MERNTIFAVLDVTPCSLVRNALMFSSEMNISTRIHGDTSQKLGKFTYTVGYRFTTGLHSRILGV
jgi:hypothetical protein